MPSKNVKDFLTVNSLNLSTASILTIVGGELKRFTGQTIVIDSSGNVGIGTASPVSVLDMSKASDTSERAFKVQNSSCDLHVGVEGTSANRFLGSSANNAFFGTTGAAGIEFATNNNVRAIIDSSGRVGIGTTSPIKELQINATEPTIRLEESGAGSKRLEISVNASAEAKVFASQSGSTLLLGTVGTERLRIDSSGNVGIGTSTAHKTLTVGSNDATAYISAGGSNVNLTIASIGSSGSVIFKTGGTNGDASTTTERLRIDSSGNVGIGIALPLVKTHIRYARSGGIASDTIAGLFLDAYHGEVTAPTVGSSIYLRSSRSATLGTQAVSVNGDDSRIRFYFSDGTNFVPAAAVNASVDGVPAANSVAGKLLFLTTSAAGTAPSTKMTIDKAGIVTITNLGTGTVSSTAGVLSAVSDARMKISDGEIENAINKIQNLKPKYFYWKDENNNKDESKGRQLGFFAQEVNEQVPEAAPGLNDQWGIYDRSLIAVLVKAVQELKVEIDILKNK